MSNLEIFSNDFSKQNLALTCPGSNLGSSVHNIPNNFVQEALSRKRLFHCITYCKAQSLTNGYRNAWITF